MRVGSVFEELGICSAVSVVSAAASEVSMVLCQVIHVPEVSVFKG